MNKSTLVTNLAYKLIGTITVREELVKTNLTINTQLCGSVNAMVNNITSYTIDDIL
jgi:hypothetical protein